MLGYGLAPSLTDLQTVPGSQRESGTAALSRNPGIRSRGQVGEKNLPIQKCEASPGLAWALHAASDREANLGRISRLCLCLHAALPT